MKQALFLTWLTFISLRVIGSNDPVNPFVKTYGGDGDDVALGVLSVESFGYFVTGYTTSYGNGDKDVFLMKIDATGNVEWFKTFGDKGDDVGLQVRLANDNGFFILGYTESCDDSDRDGYLIKTDSAGKIEWSKVFGGNDDDILREMFERPNGEILCMLQSKSYIHGNGFADFYAVVLDNSTSHKVIRGFSMGEKYNDHACDFTMLSKGEFLFAGSMTLNGANQLGHANGWIFRADQNGEPIIKNDQFAYGIPNSSEYTRFQSIKKLSGTTNIIAGETAQFGSGGYDLVIGKVDNNGDSLWFKRFDGQKVDWKPRLVVNQNKIALASISNSTSGNDDLLLYELDTNGVVNWAFTYGSFTTDEMALQGDFIDIGIDEGYILVSSNTEYSNNGDRDIYIVKTGANGEAPIGHIKNSNLSPKRAPFKMQRIQNFSKSGRIDNPNQTSCGSENTIKDFKHKKVWVYEPSMSTENVGDLNMTLYPNPSNRNSILTLESTVANLTYKIYSHSQLIQSGKTENGMTQVNCSLWPSGVYIIICADHEGQRAINKLVVTQ